MGKKNKQKEVEAPVEETQVEKEVEAPVEETGTVAVDSAVVEKEPEVESPWKFLPLLSDKDVTVEGCNVFAVSKQCCLLRYRVNGEVLPVIKVVNNYQVKIYQKIWQLR